MSSERQFICVRCPRGCEIKFSLDEAGCIGDVSGNFCKLGVPYVQTELNDPRRTLTTTVRVHGGTSPLVPVWTEAPIPKGRILELADALRGVVLKAPVRIGDVVLADALNLGIAVTAASSIDEDLVSSK